MFPYLVMNPYFVSVCVINYSVQFNSHSKPVYLFTPILKLQLKTYRDYY